jgi:hypothetical protein
MDFNKQSDYSSKRIIKFEGSYFFMIRSQIQTDIASMLQLESKKSPS